MDLRLDIRDDLIAPDERGLYRRAWLLLNFLAPGLRLFGMRRCLRLLHLLSRLPGRGTPPADPLPRARAIARVVRVATWRSAFQADCLENSLTLWYLLRRSGITGELRLGSRLSPTGLKGHAWVEVGEEVLSERNDPRLRYVPFARSISPEGGV